MIEQFLLNLRRIDVHAAPYDDVCGPIGEEQVAVGIEMADVPEGVAVPLPRRCGLVRVLVVLEPTARARHENEACLPRCQYFAFFASDRHFDPWPRSADTPRALEPFLGGYSAHAPLARAVELPDVGAR